MSRYQKKHSPTHHPGHHPIFISFFHLPRSIVSSMFKSFCTTSLHVLFGLLLGLEPSTSYSIHFFTQSVSSFRSTRPYHRNLLAQNYMKLFVAHKMAQNNTLNKVHVAATVLPQLLSQNTNMFGEATTQSHCQTLCSSKVN